MTRYGMFIDTRKCTGCLTCVQACQRQNDLRPEEQFIRFETREQGTYPDVSVETVPLQCMHCEDAPCAQVCPTGATHIGPGGIVLVDQGRCIGCKYCMAACPYQVRVCNTATGVVGKCRFCTVSALDGTKMCSCVAACVTGARIFGDLDDPNSEISKAITAASASPIKTGLTQPKIYYAR